MSHMYKGKTVTIFGGTGFVGRYIVARLAKMGALIRVVTRTPESAYFLKTYGNVGQILGVACSYKTFEDVEQCIKNSDAVINCLGILFENSKQKFESVHVEYARWIAEAAAQNTVQTLVHISALGCDQSQSQYATTKFEAEKAVFKAFPNATLLRPSVIFGAEDNFFNMFAKLSMVAPALPLIAGGHTKFQPVYVGDVADTVIYCLNNPSLTGGKIYELGGPEILSFKSILQRLEKVTERKRYLINLPTPIARVQAALFSLLPKPLLTQDQITALETDNIVSQGALGFKDLGITPKSLDEILPTYLDHYKAGGRFSDKKRA